MEKARKEAEFLGEEDGQDVFTSKMESGYCFVIDPIDGTAHFVKNDGLWGCQLAFYAENEVKFSVIYLPTQNELYYAFKNGGAFVNNEKILPLEVVPLNQAIVEFGG